MLPPLAVVWIFSITGCRDFRDHRTSYKSYVKVQFKFLNKEDLPITITSVPSPEIGDGSTLHQPSTSEAIDGMSKPIEVTASLDPHVGYIQLYIHHVSDPIKELTIYYHKEATLVSHQCGSAYKYVLNRIASNFGAKHKIINKELSTFNESAIDLEIYL